ncbi:uncharacterized protein LOC124921920 isoform X2 [Impatiens glandulifera]|uniref:uncharacterized protein LOC124921920 isoform X2 n=1 Tax=Impatiens glandulifera TaxID=253017 RepID=UPI001FB0DB69|nr:uncharacterized protein LOC124921920 isoform X2 [Impatiens glandulifera]
MVTVTEPRGWPFGLGNLNKRLQDSQSQALPVVTIQPQQQHQHQQEQQQQQQQISSHYPSSSFSSFSSSNSDTESSASFFQDHSVSLGRLMGMKPKEKKKPLYFSGTITFNSQCQCKGIPEKRKQEHGEEEEEEVMMMMGQRICVPLLVCILVKMGGTCKSRSR